MTLTVFNVNARIISTFLFVSLINILCYIALKDEYYEHKNIIILCNIPVLFVLIPMIQVGYTNYLVPILLTIAVMLGIGCLFHYGTKYGLLPLFISKPSWLVISIILWLIFIFVFKDGLRNIQQKLIAVKVHPIINIVKLLFSVFYYVLFCLMVDLYNATSKSSKRTVIIMIIKVIIGIGVIYTCYLLMRRLGFNISNMIILQKSDLMTNKLTILGNYNSIIPQDIVERSKLGDSSPDNVSKIQRVAFTISCWMYRPSIVSQDIKKDLLDTDNNKSIFNFAQKIELVGVGNTVSVIINNNKLPENVINIEDFLMQRWNHIVIRRNHTGKVDVFLNGTLVGTKMSSLANEDIYIKKNSNITFGESDGEKNTLRNVIYFNKVISEIGIKWLTLCGNTDEGIGSRLRLSRLASLISYF